MKVGILTFHFSDNFGAALQAYALRQWFLQAGHTASFVNYCPAHVEHGGRLKVGISKQVLMSNLKVIYLVYSGLKTRFFGNKKQKQAFESFRELDLGVTTPGLASMDEVRNVVKDFDLLVCGSDQIWSPSVQHGLDPVYFLNFGDTRARKISYAASFGNATEGALRAADAGALLTGLDALSVREKSGLALVRNLTGRDAVRVADPTCLLDSYKDLVEPTEVGPEGLIFCYALRTDKGVREASSVISNILGRKIIAPRNPHSRWKSLGETCHPGPREWLSLINDSSFVVTNSFHGTMFSILLEKPFVVSAIPGKKVGLNDRMLSLLESVGLQDRFVEGAPLEKLKMLSNEKVDWETVRKRLREMKSESVQFLNEQINALS